VPPPRMIRRCDSGRCRLESRSTRCARRLAMAEGEPRGKLASSPHFVYFADNLALCGDIEPIRRIRGRARSIPAIVSPAVIAITRTPLSVGLNSVRNSMRAAYREGRIS
jgi:hypothetical protein